MSISICLLNYNSYQDTIECIESLLNQSSKAFSIILVDNYSTNESVFMITEYVDNNGLNYSVYNFKNNEFECQSSSNTKGIKIYILKNSSNNGFSAGNNLAIQFSNQFIKNELILLLNNDTTVNPEFINIITSEYNYLTSQSKAPVALGVEEYSYFKGKRNHSGFNYLNLITGLVFKKPVAPCYKYLCGACLLIDNKAPLMDENYFLYFEDADYSKLLSKCGYSLYSTNKTHYSHKISSSLKNNSNKNEYQLSSLWYFYHKHYPKFQYIVFVTRWTQYFVLFKHDLIKILTDTYKKSSKND
jgi:hypothetical protein